MVSDTLGTTGGSDGVSFYETGTDTDDRGALIDDVRLAGRWAHPRCATQSAP